MPPTTKTPITSILEGKESECGGYNDEGGGPPTLLSLFVLCYKAR